LDPRTGLDDVERRKILPLLGLEHQPLCCQTHSQLVYRPRYPRSRSTSALVDIQESRHKSGVWEELAMLTTLVAFVHKVFVSNLSPLRGWTSNYAIGASFRILCYSFVMILPLDAVQSEVLTACLNHRQQERALNAFGEWYCLTASVV
jgi:uncharacterized membrane protein